MAGIVGVIVAGGKATRMNNLNKPLLPVANKPVIEHVIGLARPQVQNLVISVNRNLDDYRRFGMPLVNDLPLNLEGPLLGICSAMHWFREQDLDADYLACFPADVPAFPHDIVSQLLDRLRQLTAAAGKIDAGDKTVAWCKTGEQVQPLFSLWPFSAFTDLSQALKSGVHGPRLFFRDHPNVILALPSPVPPEFFNINTPEQLAAAELLFRQNGQAP